MRVLYVFLHVDLNLRIILLEVFLTLKAFILPSLCYQKSLGSELSSLQRKIWRLVFFTGVGALILGVVQNLPKAEVLEVEQYPDHVIQQEFESMEQLLSGAWLRSNTPLNILPQKSVVSSKNFRPEIKNVNS